MARILIDIDNPERCLRCPFVLHGQYGPESYCRLGAKHECCPLKREVKYNENDHN